jgi:hypothetical protein
LKSDAGRSRGLSEDLWILKIEPSTEREPACRQRESRPCTDLDGVCRGP